MSSDLLTQGFSFRMSDAERSLLDELADSLGCNRGEALRYLLRQQSKPDIQKVTRVATGQFAANGRTFRLKLRTGSVSNA